MDTSSKNRLTAGRQNRRKKHGLWAQASRLAAQTPPSRNRYVDFLRGVSILAVVLGHWIMAAPYYDAGTPQMWHWLAVSPWSQWLTWLFQVMPIFFFVGGYANYTSWEAYQRRGRGYAAWLAGRLQRLLQPVLPLLVLWLLLALIAQGFGVPQAFLRIGSRIALVPTWFLAVYILVALFVPWTVAAWKRFGLWSAVAPMAGAAVVDFAFFAAGWELLGWLNYLFVWLAVHQLGYAWRNGMFGAAWKNLLLFAAGILALLALVTWGPYPLSLVGVPTDAVSNTLPPKLPLLALGLAQIGLLMSLQRPARRWLDRPLPWTATVAANGMIMTVFLWHSTAMVLMIGLGFWVLPSVFAAAPGVAAWWLLRPVWVAVFAAATVPFLAAFSQFERRGTLSEKADAVWRLYLCCILTCGGLGYLALKGIGGSPHWSVDAISLALPFIGTTLAGFRPLGVKAKA
ncbi:MAG TPA: acyltransferase [Desulfosarcina sp.]|nr:acyltransferase [Desulfosarcina sp.]